MLLKDIREEIVTLGNFLLDEKLVHDMQGNISYFDRESGMIAITPSAVPYRIRKAADICVVDIDGNVLVGEKRPTSEIALHVSSASFWVLGQAYGATGTSPLNPIVTSVRTWGIGSCVIENTPA